jgi:phenylalanyl-tRNA synthetase beta chain
VLRSLEFSVKATDDADVLDVTIPSFRGDVSLEVDLIEEVARIHGYDRIPDRTELKLVHVVPRTKSDRICEEVRAVLSGMGFYEVITNSFTDAPRAALISPWTDAPPLPFNNTIRCEEGLLRLSLLPGLLQTKAANLARGILQTQLFEIGAVFLPRQGEKLPEERSCLALLDEEGFLALKGVLEAVARVSGLGGDLRLTGCAHSLFEPSHAAEVSLEGQRLWVLGDLDGKLSEEMGFKAAPALAEVNLDLVIERSVLERRFSKLPVYPASSRDIALVVDEAVTWETVEQWVRQAGGELLEDVRFFDLYRGKQVPEGKKSLAFRLTFRAPDRTLTGQEVDGIWEVVVEALKKQLGATLRSI